VRAGPQGALRGMNERTQRGIGLILDECDRNPGGRSRFDARLHVGIAVAAGDDRRARYRHCTWHGAHGTLTRTPRTEQRKRRRHGRSIDEMRSGHNARSERRGPHPFDDDGPFVSARAAGDD
jgi:hypothetical protein